MLRQLLRNLGMTLAAILSMCMICSAPSGSAAFVRTQSPAQQPDSTQLPDSAKPPDPAPDNQPGPKPQTTTPATPTQPGQKPTPAIKRKHHVKKPAITSGSGGPPASAPPPAQAATSGADVGTTGAAPPASPPKKVVRNGGTTEPAVQLTGVAGGTQASQKLTTTEQLLGSAEDNLKKASGRQLNSSQEEMVNQIQQFVEQSKAAVAAGDIERGHNLATKAHLLSDELVKPE